MTPQNNEDGPQFRDLYELQQHADERIEKVSDRLSRMEKGFAVLTLIVLSPKVGGPDATALVSQVGQHFFG